MVARTHDFRRRVLDEQFPAPVRREFDSSCLIGKTNISDSENIRPFTDINIIPVPRQNLINPELITKYVTVTLGAIPFQKFSARDRLHDRLLGDRNVDRARFLERIHQHNSIIDALRAVKSQRPGGAELEQISKPTSLDNEALDFQPIAELLFQPCPYQHA